MGKIAYSVTSISWISSLIKVSWRSSGWKKSIRSATGKILFKGWPSLDGDLFFYKSVLKLSKFAQWARDTGICLGFDTKVFNPSDPHFNSRLEFWPNTDTKLSHNSISLSVLRLTPLNKLYDALEDALEIYEVTHSFSAFGCYFDIYFSNSSIGSTL